MSRSVDAEFGTKENPHPITPPIKDRIERHWYLYKGQLRYCRPDNRNLTNIDSKKKYYEKNKKIMKEKYKESRKKYYEKNKEELNNKKRERYKNDEKNRETSIANVKRHYEKNKEEINKRRRKQYENDVKYREKSHKYNKKYYEKNKDRLNKEKKKYRKKNKEEINKRSREKYKNDENFRKGRKLYNIKNREKINKCSRDRYKKNPIRHLLSSRLLAALKRQKAFKNKRTLDYVNCSVAQVYYHLEQQFETWMTWDNLGKYDPNGPRTWQIDHRRPCDSFNFDDEEQKYMCFHWTNLQPLCSRKNVVDKGNKFDPKTFRYKWIDRETGWVGIKKYKKKKFKI